MALDDWFAKRLLRNFIRTSKLEPSNKDVPSVLHSVFLTLEGPEGARYRRMAAMINFGDTDGKYRGSKSTTYFTMIPKLLFRNITPSVTLYKPKTMREIGEALILKYGLPLSSDAFPTTPVDASILPAKIPVSIGDYYWMENDVIDVQVNQAKASIPDLFKNTVLDSPGLPTTVMTGRVPAEYTYAYDFTPDLPEDFAALLNYPTMLFDDTVKDTVMEDPGVLWLKSAIAKRLNVDCDWEVTTANSFALYKSQMIFNGMSKDYVPATADPWSPRGDTAFENLMVIQFSSDVPGRVGLGFFHYNTLGR